MVERSIPRLLRRSLWTSVAVSPADPILGLVAAFLEDPTPNKVNLAQGAYRTEVVLPISVRLGLVPGLAAHRAPL